MVKKREATLPRSLESPNDAAFPWGKDAPLDVVHVVRTMRHATGEVRQCHVVEIAPELLGNRLPSLLQDCPASVTLAGIAGSGEPSIARWICSSVIDPGDRASRLASRCTTRAHHQPGSLQLLEDLHEELRRNPLLLSNRLQADRSGWA